ncbi:MAG: DUF2804 domain-containing protein [Desulfobacterales bacterium]|nr:DUF2804 domain-containing protein [Desulfobacterales bacterium]MBF0396270.1 DUF2804 domain-containing protein [Desulfobacterales bacterium]
MNTLVDNNGYAQYGVFDHVIDHINYMDYRLETPMGLAIPNFLKKFLPNQFHFFGVISSEMMVGIAVVDLKYITNGFFYVYDMDSNLLLETKKISLPSDDILIDPYPDKFVSIFKCDELFIEMKDNSIYAKGKDILFEAKLSPENSNPLRICTKSGYNGWIYTQKTTPIPVEGKIHFKDKQINISSPKYMGLMDWTCGYMRRETFWNWASIASTLPDGKTLGLNLSCGVNETSFTENAFWLNNKMTKIDTVNFIFKKYEMFTPWHITSNDKKVDLYFQPKQQRGELVNALILASKFTQLMGTFEGELKTESGEIIKVKECPGWVEDHYAKW